MNPHGKRFDLKFPEGENPRENRAALESQIREIDIQMRAFGNSLGVEAGSLSKMMDLQMQRNNLVKQLVKLNEDFPMPVGEEGRLEEGDYMVNLIQSTLEEMSVTELEILQKQIRDSLQTINRDSNLDEFSMTSGEVDAVSDKVIELTALGEIIAKVLEIKRKQ